MGAMTEWGKKDFEVILLKYSIGKYKSHKLFPIALSNTIYLLRTTKGKFILKIFEGKSNFEINYQIKVMDHLQDNSIPVQKIIQTKGGTLVNDYGKKKMAIFEYIEGKHPKITDSTIKIFAQEMAKMQKILLRLKLKRNITWKDYQFRKDSGFIAGDINGFDVKKEFNMVVDEARKSINRTKLRKSVIHSDIADVNSVFGKGKFIAFIDWDDVHLDYLVYDLAVFIADMTPTNLGRTKLFLREYQKVLPLNEMEKKAIYYFVKNRMLGSISWLAEKIGKSKNADKNLLKKYNARVRKYKRFCGIASERSFLVD